MMEEKRTLEEAKALVEGLLYLWGDPLPLRDIAQVLEVPVPFARSVVESLREDFEHGRGLLLKRHEDCYQLVTRPEHAPYFSKWLGTKKPQRLSHSAMETLSIIAYRQPVTRVEVDDIRGVKSSSSVDTLLARGLIEEAGRLDRIGRPILYRTTVKFLQFFDLESLEDLPPLSHFEASDDAEAGPPSISEPDHAD